MPRDEEVVQVMDGFYQIAGIPGVVGAVDGTHVAIQAPTTAEWHYVNRKGYYSINVQVVADHNMIIRHLVARWPGSTHDSFIWENSSIRDSFHNGHREGIILGDSGYPLRPYLLTPVSRPETASEIRFNEAHCATRVCVERTFGLLKSRFRCLAKSGGHLLYAPDKVCRIITACCVLHNLARSYQLPAPNEGQVDADPDADPVLHVGARNDALAGRDFRRNLIQQRF